ncbi:MAG: type II pantothenate kinase [Defluviitaleaceae bacterium]|nr:type II pantothenate kinase [Defluviitaleaceae bacterium]
MIIGIDIGGSTTKIIGQDGGTLKKPLFVRATDPVASLFGAFGKFVDEHALELADIERIMVTGVGSSYITRPIYGLPTHKVDEFAAIGLGGLALSGLDNAIIVSMGTGTAIVRADKFSSAHIGGTAIGGGTILGLASRMLNVRQIDTITEMASHGNLHNVDLMVGDIFKDVMESLSPDTTASNFGKLSDTATPNDIALGILNMVFQSIGMTARFALLNHNINDMVLTGNLSTFKECREVFNALKKFFDMNFVIPKFSEFATALGAALSNKSGGTA